MNDSNYQYVNYIRMCRRLTATLAMLHSMDFGYRLKMAIVLKLELNQQYSHLKIRLIINDPKPLPHKTNFRKSTKKCFATFYNIC